jgi:beta-lactamase class A
MRITLDTKMVATTVESTKMQTFKDHVQEASMRKQFRVDYLYRSSSTGAYTRTRMVSSNTQLPSLSTSETAVLAYLKQRHGLKSEVNIISLEWLD